MLFRPVDLGKWFTIGFCAFLASLGEGGTTFNFPGGGGGGRGGPGGGNFRAEMEQAREWLTANLYWLVPVAIGVLLFIIFLGLLFTWLSSRGKFMFLHCVATDRAEVALPWRRYSGEADNLFWLRVLLWLVGFFAILTLVVGIGVCVIGMAMNERTDPLRLSLSIGGFCVFLLALSVFLLIGKLIDDFLVPIMYLRGKGWREAGGELLHLIQQKLGVFVLYLLFQIVLGMVIGMAALLLVLVTCCIAGCIMAIPYLGTVVLLPVFIFKRAYSLYFLAQFGPQYDVFRPGTGAQPA